MPIAIVTGANSGIGRATALTLAEHGFDVGLTWHEDEEGARDAVAECERLGVRADARQMDLAQLPEAVGAVDELIEALGGVDVFVNNAGEGQSDPFLELDLESWRRTLDVDLTGAFLCAQRAARRMVDQGRGGRIVNVTSIHEHLPLKGSSAYCAAKGGLGLLTRVMAVELAEHGITCNSVAPGEIATKMTGQEDDDPSGERRPAIPVGRPGHVREIAAVVAFLASPEASYATGQSFIIDGGLALMGAVANQEATS